MHGSGVRIWYKLMPCGVLCIGLASPGTRRYLGWYLDHLEMILTHPAPPGLTDTELLYGGQETPQERGVSPDQVGKKQKGGEIEGEGKRPGKTLPINRVIPPTHTQKTRTRNTKPGAALTHLLE